MPKEIKIRLIRPTTLWPEIFKVIMPNTTINNLQKNLTNANSFFFQLGQKIGYALKNIIIFILQILRLGIKLGIILALILAFFFGGYYVFRLIRHSMLESKITELEEKTKKLEPLEQKLATYQKTAQQEQERLKSLQVNINNTKEEIRKYQKKTQIRFDKLYYNANHHTFEYRLCAENNISIILNSFELKIWKRANKTESPQLFKNRLPFVFTGEIIPQIKINAQNCYPERQLLIIPTAIFSMFNYRDWLQESEWIELTFSGQDANGHPINITLQGAD